MAEPPPKRTRSKKVQPAGSADRFELLVESVIDYAIFMLDASGAVASWNAGARRMKGYEASEIIGRHFSVFYPPEQDAADKCAEELRVAEEVGRFEETGWRVRKDGSRIWAHVVITRVVDRTGKLIGFAKVTRDLTERRQAEESLLQSEARLRLLVASVTDYAIFFLDTTGRVVTWNAGAQRLKGYSEREIVGEHFSRFYPTDDVRAGKCEMELEGAARVGRFEDEGWRIRKDGTRFWANVVITAVRGDDGVLVGFAKVTRDLTERRKHEDERVELARAEEARRAAQAGEERARVLVEELRVARDRAERATQMKDEFLATVSHELRTPLNAIMGWSQMLMIGGMPPERQTHALETIVRNATAQNQIIEDLLDVSRIVAGRLRLDVDVIDIDRVVRAAIDVVRHAADAKGITLTSDLDPNADCIRGDAGRIQQILWNLLTNAVKFTPRGGRVHVALRREVSSIEIEIADTGRGIAPEFLSRVFERFTQQESDDARRTGGLGLGLAIVKHMVELHGGTVEAHSRGRDMGTTFVVRLPVAAVARDHDVKPRESSSGQLTIPSELAGLNVLVVDDERDARELVQAVLLRARATVRLAASAAEALASIREQRPDVIISDVGMPDQDGYTFIRDLRLLSREEGGRIPAVALTAFARPEDRRKALLAGFQNHAAKPIEPQELLMVVANLAGRFG